MAYKKNAYLVDELIFLFPCYNVIFLYTEVTSSLLHILTTQIQV